MGASSLSWQAVSDIFALIKEATADTQAGLPCAGVVIVGDGQNVAQELFHDVDESKDIYWLASCTKLVTSIACLQLVEKGLLSLDDADQIKRLCPELKNIKIATEDGRLVDKMTRITLRSLLTHTSGFGYSFLSPALEKYTSDRRRAPFDEFSGSETEMHQPLVNQPGMTFQYSISHDWAGILVQRTTSLGLNEYMQRTIFKPLGITRLTMFPDEKLQSHLAGLWQRDEAGQLSPRPFPLSRALDADRRKGMYNSGGAGLYGSLREFSKILVALLNNGTSPTTNEQILLPSTVKDLFTNQLPEQPDLARQPLPTCKSDLVYPAPGLYPLCPPTKPQGWGLGALLSPSVTGRSDSTAHWAGLSNVFWWCDWERGVAGLVGSQVLPFADPKAVELWVKVETKVYEGIKKK